MSIIEAVQDEALVQSMHDRIHQLIEDGMTEKQAVSHVVAEVRSYATVSQNVHFRMNEVNLATYLTTGQWPEQPMTAEEILEKYSPR